jgi:cytochrome c peroxidase
MRATALALICCVLLAGAGLDEYQWNLPKGFPKPRVPADNPMTAAKVELGRYLFYDARLSVNGKSSCATCHQQVLAFTDGRALALGATGEAHSRSSMSLVNVAYSAAFNWSNREVKSLEEQALGPMYGEHPVELGLRPDGGFLRTLRSDAKYRALFENAFPGDNAFTVGNVTKAIASFERSIISARSPYDAYHYGGDDNAVSASAKQGEVLFFSQQLQCFRCHGGFTFSDATDFEGRERTDVDFHNTGVSPAESTSFKTPTLRNIALTSPYMHDGSVTTLEAAFTHYANVGKAGHENPGIDPLLKGFSWSMMGRLNLIAFLQSLTDLEVTRDPRFSNPWK